ncbi:homeobox protein knotted-1-like 2 [Cornus florida]|uniref:homeobox protein knotted-1-like 2 n=1 Tax=Cornus florida TaxID=4283 RepID=UPI00289CB371|nr:homeobox protein knotted-1-like 2 [Cornus florida]
MEGKSGENYSVRFGGEGVEEDTETLKKRILGHPLYGLLTETHLNCLKIDSYLDIPVTGTKLSFSVCVCVCVLNKIDFQVCLGDIEEVDITALNQADTELNATIPRSSELDNFMEVYCMALGKLKDAMEKPLQETTTFINSMYTQLNELSVTQEPTSPLQ